VCALPIPHPRPLSGASEIKGNRPKHQHRSGEGERRQSENIDGSARCGPFLGEEKDFLISASYALRSLSRHTNRMACGACGTFFPLDGGLGWGQDGIRAEGKPLRVVSFDD
jgi:hypothetical protein